MLAGVMLGSSVLLVPTYLYLNRDISTRQSHVAQLDASLGLAHGKETTAQLNDLTSTATYLARLASTTQATAALRMALAVPRPGIVLTGITFQPPVHANDGKMTLNGTATTREALRAYNDALSALPSVSSVDLPISAYAKDKDIPFTITLTGTLSP